MKQIFLILCIDLICCCNASLAQFKQVLIAGDSPKDDLSVLIYSEKGELHVTGNKGLYASIDTGRTWHIKTRDRNPHNAPEMNPTPGKKIKSMCVCEGTEPGVFYGIWTALSAEKSTDPRDSSFIYYASKSSEQTWKDVKRASAHGGDCKMGDSTLMGAVCCTGPDMALYASWAGPQGLMFKNLNDQKNNSEKVVAAFKNGWQYKVGKNIKCNGLPSIACDQSKGEHNGRLYLCWSDERHGIHNKNVFLIYSDDKGENWTEPIVVTYRPNHKEQFMPFMTLDQSSGDIYILYYDQQNFAEGDLADVYLARSKNGGLKFEYYKINNRPIKPHPDQGFGSRLGLCIANQVIRPLWQQTEANHQSQLYTALLDEETLAGYNKNYIEEIEIQKTFSWSDKIKIDFVLNNNTAVTAVITKPLEAGFEKTVIKNKKMKKGKNTMLIDTKKMGLMKGNYTLTLYHNHQNTFVWILEE